MGLGLYGWYLIAMRNRISSGNFRCVNVKYTQGSWEPKTTKNVWASKPLHSRESGFSPAGSRERQTLVCRENLTDYLCFGKDSWRPVGVVVEGGIISYLN